MRYLNHWCLLGGGGGAITYRRRPPPHPFRQKIRYKRVPVAASSLFPLLLVSEYDLRLWISMLNQLTVHSICEDRFEGNNCPGYESSKGSRRYTRKEIPVLTFYLRYLVECFSHCIDVKIPQNYSQRNYLTHRLRLIEQWKITCSTTAGIRFFLRPS